MYNKDSTVDPLNDIFLDGRTHLSIAIILFTIAFTTPHAESYEISVVTIYTPWFWVLLVFCAFISALGILTRKLDPAKNLSMYALGCIFVLLLLTPLLRGYYLYGRGDVMTHFGSLQWIINNGMIDTAFGNFYPGVHIFGAVLSIISGLSQNTLTFLSPSLFSIAYVIGFVLLSRHHSNNRRILMLLAVIPFLGTDHLYFIPHSSAMLFIPIALFIYMQSSTNGKWRYYLICMLVFTSLVFLHPTATLLLVLSCTVISLVRVLSARYSHKISHSKAVQALKRTTITSVITFIIAFAWYFSFPRTGRAVVSKFISVFLPQNPGTSRLGTYSSIISETTPSLLDLIKLGVYTYGDLMLLSGIALLIIIYRLRYGIKGTNKEVSSFYASNALYFGFLFLFLSSFVINYFLGPTGSSRYLTLSSILVIAFGLPNPRKCMKKSVFSEIQISAFVSIIFVLMFVFSIINLYPSPMIAEPNHQITEAEWEGSDWFFEYHKEGSKIRGFKFSPYRFYTAHYGRNTPQHITNVDYLPREELGYEQADRFSTSHPHTDYFIYSTISTVIYEELYPDYKQSWTYPPKSFQQLQTDPSVNRIYDNGGFWVNEIGNS